VHARTATREGDTLIARATRVRGGEKLRRRVLVMLATVVVAVRIGGGRAVVSLTTVTPDAFMKFCKLLFISYIYISF